MEVVRFEQNPDNRGGAFVMGLEKVNPQAKGGTELLIDEFKRHIPEEIYNHFHIVPSRNRGLEPGKIPIYWAHDLVGDPECDHLKAGGYNQYEKLIFVSNWQMQQFVSHYGIPWRKCIVINNAIEPLLNKEKQYDQTINLIYHTTPHRGLEILAPVFDKLCERYTNIHLDVFSSFEMYDCSERDDEYKNVIDMLQNNKQVTYHGFKEHSVVREYVENAHIFAYPSIWMETSCRSLMEAMSAGLLCVHSNFGALYETAAGWTWMYQYHENKRDHAIAFYHQLCAAIENISSEGIRSRLTSQSSYANIFYNWEMCKNHWIPVLKGILREKGIEI